jgi:hypothetical protein
MGDAPCGVFPGTPHFLQDRPGLVPEQLETSYLNGLVGYGKTTTLHR